MLDFQYHVWLLRKEVILANSLVYSIIAI